MSDTASCPVAFFFFLEIPRMFCYHEISISASPRMKSSEVAHILYLLCKKALYSYLVYTRQTLYLFIPCWLKYQFTRIVNPVIFAQKSNVTFFPACYPVTSAFQSCESFNYISAKSYVKHLPANDNFQFLSVITQSSHSVCTVNFFVLYIFFIFAHHRVPN